MREFEKLRYAIDPPLDALARVVDSEKSGPALCAACILLEHDLAAHAERVFAFVRGFPPLIEDRGPAAKYAPYARLLNAWVDALIDVDTAVLRELQKLPALAASSDPGPACAAALALFQADPALHRALAGEVARRHREHPLAVVLLLRLNAPGRPNARG